MYADIFLKDYAKNMVFKQQNSGSSMSQMELLRTKGIRLCGILQSSVISRLKLDNQIVFIDKNKSVKMIDINIPGDIGVN